MTSIKAPRRDFILKNSAAWKDMDGRTWLFHAETRFRYHRSTVPTFYERQGRKIAAYKQTLEWQPNWYFVYVVWNPDEAEAPDIDTQLDLQRSTSNGCLEYRTIHVVETMPRRGFKSTLIVAIV